MSNPALWTAIAGVVGAVAALVAAWRAAGKAADAHDIVVGHVIDRTAHTRGPNPPGGPSSG